MQQILDDSKKPGKFILTGSNNFLIQENITQSLAGRIAYLTLLPFSVSELSGIIDDRILDYMLGGSYPPIYDQDVEVVKWHQNYQRTYIERDVRQIINISNLYLFERFVKLCAGRTGQLLNINSLSIETGVDHKTIQSWLSVLESSFIVYRLYPHHKNFNKRVVKMPKLYFYDTGILCSLLGIQNIDQLDLHPLKGNIFENMIISEIIKSRYNRGMSDMIYFWRNNTGHEVDLLVEQENYLLPIEIKAGKTITSDFFKGIEYWKKLSKTKHGMLI